jgi:SPP1 family predicted phage head-tail adaptor
MSVPVSSGDLVHRIVIESPVRSDDGAGGGEIVWEPLAEVSAAIWPRSVSQTNGQDRITGRATHDIWLRHRGDVAPEMRIRFGTRLFEILGVIDIETRGRWIKCPVEERDL